jgi:peroxiredoxin
MLRTSAVSLLVALTVVVLGAGEIKKVENFSLEDANGKKHSLSDYKSAKGVVLMFIATQCPVSNAYNERMVALERDYAEKGFVFIGINSNKQESVEEIKEHAAKHGFRFPILKDHKNVIADKLQASVTPEIFVLNGSLEVLYHGGIDDSQREARVTVKSLRVALDEILAGKPVTSPTSKAFGCTIKRID